MAPSMYNVYILNSHDDAMDHSTTGNTGRISQTDSECYLQEPCGVYQKVTLKIIIKQATALTILKALTLLMQTAEVAMPFAKMK